MNKIAVIFSGVGYTTDRPLLYYAGRLAVAHGYEVVSVDFSGIRWSKEELKDHRRFAEILDECLKKTELKLGGVKMGSMEEIVFISKSIGTVVAAWFAKEKGIRAKQIYFSPLVLLEEYAQEGGIAFYGDSDPLADAKEMERICAEKKIKAYKTAGGNHSLETGDTEENLKNLTGIMKSVKEYIR